MFKIDFSLFICYYLCGQLFILWLFWLFEKKAGAKQNPLSNDQIWQCPICFYVYFESKVAKISTCPVCGSFNERAVNQLGGGK